VVDRNWDQRDPRTRKPRARRYESTRDPRAEGWRIREYEAEGEQIRGKARYSIVG